MEDLISSLVGSGSGKSRELCGRPHLEVGSSNHGICVKSTSRSEGGLRRAKYEHRPGFDSLVDVFGGAL